MPSILLIDDNAEILSSNKNYLTGQGFSVTCADTGIKALACLNEQQYDCIVLDVLLPDMDGYTLCKAARTITNAPILFLSCMEEADDKIIGLESGGDDYMTKPYNMNELSARVSALLRRSEINMTLRDGTLIDRRNRIIQTNEKSVFLSQKEFELFLLLHDNPKSVFSKEEIFEKIWNGSSDIGTVAVHIMRLRRKIKFAENQIGQIENSYGTGYYFSPPEFER